jgi:hypothetical protein
MQNPVIPLEPTGGPIGVPVGEPFRSTIKNGPPEPSVTAGQREKSHGFATRLDLQNRSLPINVGTRPILDPAVVHSQLLAYLSL